MSGEVPEPTRRRRAGRGDADAAASAPDPSPLGTPVTSDPLGAAAPDLSGIDAALAPEHGTPVPASAPAPAAASAPAPVPASAPEPPRLPAPTPVLEAPSADVAAVPAASRLPGAARDGYATLPTAPVVTTATGPLEGDVAEFTGAPGPRAVVGPWALGLAVTAVIASFFVGWMLPVGLAAVVAAIVTLRRPVESRAVAIWALVLGALSLAYSAGWLLWAIPQLPSS